MFQRLTYKKYMELFCISEATAKRWLAADRKKLKKKRLFPRHIMAIHCLDENDF